MNPTASEQEFLTLISASVDARVSGDLGQSIELAVAACDRWPDEAAAWHTLAMVTSDLGMHSDALYARFRAVSLLEGKEIPPDKRQYVQQCIFGYASSLLLAGHWSKAWQYWEAGRLGYSWMPPAGTQYWQGEQDGGLLVVCEGGYGDLFLFSRFLSTLCTRFPVPVGLIVHRGMRDFRDWSRMGVYQVFEVGDEFPVGVWKYATSILSLPGQLGFNGFERIPSDVLYGPPKMTMGIGFCWRSEEFMTKRRFRSLSRDEASEIVTKLSRRGMSDLWSLSPHAMNLASEDGQFQQPFGLPIQAHKMTTWKETAEYISGLQMVISVDTAVAHLAGLLGVPTLLLLPLNTDWKWQLTGETTPWYPSVRLFRNTLPLAWETERIVETAVQMYEGLA